MVSDYVGGIMGIRSREWLIERLLSITIPGITHTLRYDLAYICADDRRLVKQCRPEKKFHIPFS